VSCLHHARDLDEGWRAVAASLDTGADVVIDAEGRLHAAAVDAIAEPASLIDLRRRLEAMLPRVDIGELILEVMAWHPAFVQAFAAASGGQPRLKDLQATIAAALTAHALNIGFGPVVSPGVPALTRGRISHVDQNYLRAENYAAANTPLIEAQADIALARALGGGLVAAVDGLRFIVPVRSVDARPNPRYFGRKRGATWLNMISDLGIGLSGKVVSGTPRNSLHLIDLIYGQDAGQRPEVIISDTGAYSDNRVRVAAPARLRLPARACRSSRRQAVAHRPARRLRPLESRGARQDRPRQDPAALAGHRAARRIDPHGRGQRARRHPDARPGRQPDAAR